MTDKTIKLDLSQIGDGGLQEKVDKELEKVIANILDPNTETKTARKLAITLTMKPDDTRSNGSYCNGSQVNSCTSKSSCHHSPHWARR